MRAMILAAGVGSRLDPLTSQIPKPLVPIANKPVMEHIINLLKRHGITKIVSNLHHLPQKLEEYFQDGSSFGVKLKFHYEPVLSGDAGGVRACREFLQDGTFVVLMGDLATDADLSYVISQHKKKGALATIALKKVEDVSQLGIAVIDKNGFITGFQEKPQPHEAISNLASTGIYILEPEVFEHIPSSGQYGFGRQLFPDLLKKNLPLLGVEIDGYWSDVGTIKLYKQSNFDALHKLMQIEYAGQQTSFGWADEGAYVSDDCHIDGLLMVGKNSRLLDGVRIKGTVIIGDNCTIGSKAELEDTVIWSDTSIESQAMLKDSVIGFNCQINGAEKIHEATVVANSNDATTDSVKL